MNILQIHKYHYMRGGAERVFFNTMSLLREHGNEVAPFCTIHPDNEPSAYEKYFVEAPEIRELGITGKIKAIPRFFRNKNAVPQLERLIADFKPDIAHIHNIFNGLSISILPILHKHRIPVVMTVHDPRLACPSTDWLTKGDLCSNCRKSLYSNCLKNRCCDGSSILSTMGMMEMIDKDFVANMYRYIDRYIFLNTLFRDEMSKDHPEIKQRSEILFNFAPELKITNSARGNYYLYFGRLTKEKGVTTLIEAARRTPEVNFVIAGDGPLEQDFVNADLPNVELRGFITGNDLHKAIKESSFIVVPSECHDNNPMTIIEGYSYGKPVIASNIGGIPDILTDNVTGRLVTPFNPDALAKIIRETNKISDELYNKMSTNAIEFAKHNFNAETHYNRLMEIYKKTLNDYK